METYKVIKVIGDGTFGVVSKAINIKTNEVVAIKKMKKKFLSWEECMQLREIKSLKKLNHPNIIRLKEVIYRKVEELLITRDIMARITATHIKPLDIGIHSFAKYFSPNLYNANEIGLKRWSVSNARLKYQQSIANKNKSEINLKAQLNAISTYNSLKSLEGISIKRPETSKPKFILLKKTLIDKKPKTKEFAIQTDFEEPKQKLHWTNHLKAVNHYDSNVFYPFEMRALRIKSYLQIRNHTSRRYKKVGIKRNGRHSSQDKHNLDSKSTTPITSWKPEVPFKNYKLREIFNKERESIDKFIRVNISDVMKRSCK